MIQFPMWAIYVWLLLALIRTVAVIYKATKQVSHAAETAIITSKAAANTIEKLTEVELKKRSSNKTKKAKNAEVC